MLLINFQINFQPKWLGSFIKKAEKCLQSANISNNQVSLLFCSSAYMRWLNFKYRNIDKSTDVLSWEYNNLLPAFQNLLLGDIAICMPKVINQAKFYAWSEENESLRLFVHGLAHLLGYQHETNLLDAKIMLNFELQILKSIGIDLSKHPNIIKNY